MLGRSPGTVTPPSVSTETLSKHHLTIALNNGTLTRVNAARPEQVLRRVSVDGLQSGEMLLGIDYRVSRGTLYGLTSLGRLLILDAETGKITPVGSTPIGLRGQKFGFDFNPVADRLRVVSDVGQNLRLHPDTGAVAAIDPTLIGSDFMRITAAAYTYNKKDEKLTTNYAIDTGRGLLVRQGSLEGALPVISPNTGRIEVVGDLGLGKLEDACFDIADTDNTAIAAVRQQGRWRLIVLDLGTGAAKVIGALAARAEVSGLAIEP
jgi:hypothetical protein